MIFSYTLIDTFHNVCPRQAYERWWLKLPIPDTPEMDYGKRSHAYIEEYITKNVELPDWLRHVGPVVQSLRQRGGDIHAEHKCAVSRVLEPCDFWDRGALIRGAVDVLWISDGRALVLDWKTGKKRDKELQLLLYALFVLATFPEVAQVSSVNYYLRFPDAPMGEPLTWTRAQLSEMWREVLPLVEEIEEAERVGKFPERQGPLCKWCPVTKCQYNRSDHARA